MNNAPRVEQDKLDDLDDLRSLERLEVKLFRGESRDQGGKQVFGGQVLGQALYAASQTVEDRCVHSLHAYFLRRGDMQAPIVYEVDHQLDGRSFANRRVVAIQHGKPILNLACSFQRLEDGMDHQRPMPDVPDPETLSDLSVEDIGGTDKLSHSMKRFLFETRPFNFRWVQTPQLHNPESAEPVRQLWFKAAGKLPDDDDIHRSMLVYASDYGLLTTSLLPHQVTLFTENLQLASLDHAMYFHRPFRIDDWLLYSLESPIAIGARGLSRGQVFNRQGELVASVSQEGLIRMWKSKS